MSLEIRDVRVGDMLVMSTNSVYAHKDGIEVAKFLVLGKRPNEAENDKDYEGPNITLYMVWKEGYSVFPHNVGSTITMEILPTHSRYEAFRWKVDYRPYQWKEEEQSTE